METSAVETDLSTTLSRTLHGARITGLHRLSGGASRETWRFEADGRPLVVQRQRAGDERDMLREAEVVRAAGEGGAPVPALLEARRRDDGLAFMVLEAVDGETIARKIQRDDEFATARTNLVADLGRALAKIHALDPDAVQTTATSSDVSPAGPVSRLEEVDQVAQYTEALDTLGEPHPVLELVRNWLIDRRPERTRLCIVHGDFRLGNVIVGPEGLRAVIDWELAHFGDPMEDLGWLCVKAWRFGGRAPVAGLGDYSELFEAYEAAGGEPVDPPVVHWWEVLGTWKWAVMCILQASVHRSGVTRSHELAAIGRRVCENEYDLLTMLEGRW